jgi:hypothetical protein
MKDGISQQRPAERIQALIDAIGDSAVNRTGNTCINIIHNEFVFLEEPFTVPRISVKELDTATSWLIAGNLVKSIPRFLAGHTFLEKRVPAADQHMMHFTRRLHGRVMDFTHLFKADMKFGGDPPE